MITIKEEGRTIKYKDDQKTRDKVFDALIKWYFKNNMFCGESICQSDGGYIESPIILSEIADDIIKFKVEWKE